MATPCALPESSIIWNSLHPIPLIQPFDVRLIPNPNVRTVNQ